MKLLASANILSGPANFKIPSGQYAAFMVRASGTNQAAQTLAIANLGLITATWRNNPIASLTFANLNVINQLMGGVAESASAVGAAFTFSCFYVASPVGDGNVFDVTDDDDIYISVDLSGVTATLVASGTIQLFGLMAQGAQAYIPRLFSATPNIAANGTQPYDVAHDNVGYIFFGTLTNVSRVQVVKDGQVMAQGTVADLLAASNFENRVETAVATSFIVNLARSRTIDESLSDNVTVTVDAGAGGAAAPVLIDLSYDFTDDVLERSRRTVENVTALTQNRKIQLGKHRAVRVAQRVAGE